MAIQLSHCSSSSTTFSSLHHETSYFSKWVTEIHFRRQLRNHFELKSANGYPLNAVPMQDEGSVAKPLEEEVPFPEFGETNSMLSITVVGASGDLAKKKIFPALFALYYEDWLPENFVVYGYARTKMTDEELRNMISKTLTCRIDRRENCQAKMEEFLKRCFYHSGQYNSPEDFLELNCKLKEREVMSCLQLHFTDFF